jgi:hypothetical protein
MPTALPVSWPRTNVSGNSSNIENLPRRSAFPENREGPLPNWSPPSQ